jgi:uncharacterized protein (TIGR03086 family)
MHDTPKQRYAAVSGAFDRRVRAVPADRWDSPAPCEGWVARDIVRHLYEWVPSVLAPGGVVFTKALGDPDDPVASWAALHDALGAALDDPAIAAHEFDAGPPGTMTVEHAIDMLVVGDLFVHTWDLARATGLDETLDAEFAAAMLAGMEPMDAMLRASGHFGPRVEVSPDADPVTRLIAFTGRRP